MKQNSNPTAPCVLEVGDKVRRKKEDRHGSTGSGIVEKIEWRFNGISYEFAWRAFVKWKASHSWIDCANLIKESNETDEESP